MEDNYFHRVSESSFVEELHSNFRVFSVRDAVPIGMLIFDCPMIKKYAD